MDINDFSRTVGLTPADLGTSAAPAAHAAASSPAASAGTATPAETRAVDPESIREANATVTAAPRVRAEANRLGVRLATLALANQGVPVIGYDGPIEPQASITMDQVRSYAAARDRVTGGNSASGRRSAPPAAATPATGSGRATRASLFDSFRQVTVDEYGTNPVLDDARQIYPEKHAAALAAGDPAPALFATGNLPVFTSSGLAVTALSALPWSARIPAARADHAEATQIINYFTPGGGRDRAALAAEALMFFASHEGNHEYIGRVRSWLNQYVYSNGAWVKQSSTLGF
jgi:hypothetical protein